MTLMALLILLFLVLAASFAEHVRDLEVSEGAPIGTRIGFIGDGAQDSGPPYLIVPVGSAADEDLTIDHNTGEIRTKVLLDRETRSTYSLVAIPISGDNVKVVVQVLDENDNAPTFPTAVMSIEFPENTPRDVKRTLHPAKDLDLDSYNTQRYNIVSGNVNNAFRLSSHRERDGVLYLDLQINGFLDRESTPAYSLVIEALDGGTPPLRGEMTVNITIQDVNDNQPIFNQSRYFATVPENATVGTSVLQVFASDVDAGENGQIEYSINRRQSDRDNMFRIDSTTGLIAVNKPLDFETKELHELVIVAKDHGLQPLETTAFVSIKVTDVNDNQPIINVIFLSEDATPKISESAQPGEFVARISVNDPDSKTEYSNINVTLSGGDGRFGLTTRDNIIYLVIVSLPLDREMQPNYTLNVVATDTGNPPLHASRTINLMVTDINDNAPEFEQEVYQANVMEVSDPGSSVLQVLATDKDEGNNSAIVYSLLNTTDTHSSWFQIDSRSGLITTRAHVDCETDPLPRLTVIATDNGFPPLSSSATVLVTIHDVNDNEPIFDQSFYNVSVAENEPEGRCILKVSATDPDCGVNAMVNYTLGDGHGKLKEFEIRSGTGEVCITSTLDYETRSVYEFPVIATDRGGLSTTAMVKIQVSDVNDNRPIFYPSDYKVSLREGGTLSASTPVVVIAATDLDSGRFGSVSYKIVAGNDEGLFRIDRSSGEIFVTRPNLLSSRNHPYHELNISATDGANLKSLIDAEVFISVIDSAQKRPIFEHPRYTYTVSEDVKKDTVVGNVKATIRDPGGNRNVRYSIYSGDPEGFFRIDPSTGAIATAISLDYEKKSSVLLNVQATNGDPPVYGHTQVNIDIEDVNDNAPEFESSTVKISVPENVPIGSALYAAMAQDKDSGDNGLVRYRILNNGATGGLFAIDSKTGHLTLTRPLDYETVQRHSLLIAATDLGMPVPLSANLTVLVDVQDVNDNAPVFERNEYSLMVLESLPVNSQVLQVTAVDLDTGNNARLTYRLVTNKSDDSADLFEIFPNSGWIYLKGNLDRETKEHYQLIVGATDNGTPSQSATTRVLIDVLDANDNDPMFEKESYEFDIEENSRRGTVVGRVFATDKDTKENAAVRYHLIPSNSSFQINSLTGEISSREPLDREQKSVYDLVVEARDQGVPSRSSRVALKAHVLDVNDNAPEIVDPQEDVVSVREEQPVGTEVVKIRAVDPDNGRNASIAYSLLKNRDSDGHSAFTIDPVTGVIRTRMVLDHEEKTIYRLAIAATDSGKNPKQTVRMLRVEVLDLNDNRPTFTSSSLIFSVKEDVKIGYVLGSVANSESDGENRISGSSGGHITYTLVSLTPENGVDAFDIGRNTGTLVVARELDREKESEYRLEVRALDTSAMNNPQSSAIAVRIDVIDCNDNAPKWPQDPIAITLSENTEIGSSLYNFSAFDADSDGNGQIRYSILQQNNAFLIDSLTGTLILSQRLDYEETKEYTLVVRATDQSANVSERLSTSVTARILVTDSNDNVPKFVAPVPSQVSVSEATTVGMMVAQVLAVDTDSGDNGRVTYVITSGNDDNMFALGYDTGVLTLAKPLPDMKRISWVLNVTATDHGTPTLHADMEMRLVLQSSESNAPKFFNSVVRAEIAEDAPMHSFVTKVTTPKSGEDGANITFYMPEEIADNTFEIDQTSGRISTTKALDREKRPSYSIPVYITDSTSEGKTSFDVVTVVIKILDVNDNTPEFKRGSCYRLYIPENSDIATVHTVVARDFDEGNNGEITYAITGGNIGNKFSIDMRTGELTARPLDRESHSQYHLLITAQDRGKPSLERVCNMTIIVEDQNDNDPKFDLSKYSTSIPEDVSVDTSILTVHASDADTGHNARIIYSLANESQWLFRIDNKTGVVTTAGLFDRERQDSYNFLVVATDSGKYNARSQKVPVYVRIDDINDNKPIFTQYPFREKVASYKQPGQTIMKISAKDSDLGTNSEILYSLANDQENDGKFRINPNTGILTATQSLSSDNGKIIHMNVVATDKGNPPRSSTGLIEITIGDVPEGAQQLRFQNSTYKIVISENTNQFKEVIQVSAVRTDGRRQKIVYSFGTGNEQNIFSIDSESGNIHIRDSKNLDYEKHKELVLVVEAKTEGYPTLHGYCSVHVQLLDVNDNAPKFTQEQYSASVWEGNNKGAFVLQVVAFDADEGQNSRILYHIVDGNHDNAFKIEPAFSGILKTNIVLDREIRDVYKLTVIATDEGVPQMTGTARILINIVDVNDNQPTFPAPRTISVSEATDVGSSLTTVTANDVDTNPTITYSFAEDNRKEDMDYFSIDRFSGKVLLRKRLDYEDSWRQEFKLKIVASDTAHLAETTLSVNVVDVNDNAPKFSEVYYEANLPGGQYSDNVEILAVNTTDADSGDNSKVTYSLKSPVPGFTIGRNDGILLANLSLTSTLTQDVHLTIFATDMGEPPLTTPVSACIKVNSRSSHLSSSNQKDYKIQISENTQKGTTILRLSRPLSGSKHALRIVDGNEDGTFEFFNPALVLIKSLDREIQDSYKLHIANSAYSNYSAIVVTIGIEDENDNAPIFKELDQRVSISEKTQIGTVVKNISATDADLPGSVNSDIKYDITSGNDEKLFYLEGGTGLLTVNKTLDFDQGTQQYHLVLRACDKAAKPLCSLTTLTIALQDENDNEPKFPVSEYMEFVAENEPVGTAIFAVHATDLDKGPFGALNYSIVTAAKKNYPGIDDTSKLFHIDPSTGLVTTNAVFDYEQNIRYIFLVKATDLGGISTSVKVRIEIGSKDEFHPQFTERTYKFVLATSVILPVGYVVGHVIATDRDKGPDGRVVYQLTTQHAYFKINRTTGAIILKRKLDDSNELGRDVSVVVTASSGRQGSLTNMTVVEISLDPLADPGTNLAVNRENNATVAAANGGIADWALGLLIALILLLISFGSVFVFLHMRNKRNKKINKPNLNAEPVCPANNYVDPSAFDTIPIRGTSGVSGGNNQFAPPKYDEIPPYGPGHAASSNSGAATTSELSGSDQSGSSGRGSAEDGEDGEDEEIRMINEGPLQRDSGIHRQNDDDNLSDVSVRNTQEYLARLGIVNNSGRVAQNSTRLCPDRGAGTSKESIHHHQTVPLDSLHIFDEEGNNENEMNLIYAKLNDVTGSDRASSTDEGSGVVPAALAPTMEHVMAMGGYGEVPPTHQPSMNGSLSSIVHSEEELAGSYNWDYLLDWGPQYQPLAHVFSEIARLKDDTASVKSGASAASSVKSKNSMPAKNIPPPLITSVAPRSIAMPVLNARGASSHHGGHNQMLMLPRSPINHEATSGAAFSAAMSPSFSPSLSPLATKSPSISPLVTPGLSTSHHVMSRQPVPQVRNKTVVDTELRI